MSENAGERDVNSPSKDAPPTPAGGGNGAGSSAAAAAVTGAGDPPMSSDPKTLSKAVLEVATTQEDIIATVKKLQREVQEQKEGAARQKADFLVLKARQAAMELILRLPRDVRAFYASSFDVYQLLQAAIDLIKSGDLEGGLERLMDALLCACGGISTCKAVGEGLDITYSEDYYRKLFTMAIDEKAKEGADPRWRDPKVVSGTQRDILKACQGASKNQQPRANNSNQREPVNRGNYNQGSKGDRYDDRKGGKYDRYPEEPRSNNNYRPSKYQRQGS